LTALDSLHEAKNVYFLVCGKAARYYTAMISLREAKDCALRRITLQWILCMKQRMSIFWFAAKLPGITLQ
jgi:hypothetical protein